VKRRAKRDLITLLGVVVIIAGIVGVNTWTRLDTLKEHYRKMRMALEEKYRSEGYYVIEWDAMRQTKGSVRSGAEFPEALKERDGQLNNICGFMMPIDQFRNVSEFMLLPVPLICYFCDAPPMRDVIEVKLTSAGKMINEPIVVGGRLNLHEEPGADYFYTMEEALWNEAVKEGESTDKEMDMEHKIHHIQGFQKMGEERREDLVPGQAVPGESAPPETAPRESAGEE
jgi:hypothetical protein